MHEFLLNAIIGWKDCASVLRVWGLEWPFNFKGLTLTLQCFLQYSLFLISQEYRTVKKHFRELIESSLDPSIGNDRSNNNLGDEDCEMSTAVGYSDTNNFTESGKRRRQTYSWQDVIQGNIGVGVDSSLSR